MPNQMHRIFSSCACHPCAGAVLIVSASIPEQNQILFTSLNTHRASNKQTAARSTNIWKWSDFIKWFHIYTCNKHQHICICFDICVGIYTGIYIYICFNITIHAIVYVYAYIYIYTYSQVYIINCLRTFSKQTQTYKYIYIYICLLIYHAQTHFSAGGHTEPNAPDLLELCVSSLRRGRANILCIVPSLTDDPRKEYNTL